MNTPKTIFIAEPETRNGMPAIWKDWPKKFKETRATIIFKNDINFLFFIVINSCPLGQNYGNSRKNCGNTKKCMGT